MGTSSKYRMRNVKKKYIAEREETPPPRGEDLEQKLNCISRNESKKKEDNFFFVFRVNTKMYHA